MESSAQSAVTVRLEDYEDGFLAELARLGYASRSREAQRGLVRHLSRWLAMRGLALSELSEEVAGQYAAARREERSHLRSERALGPLLDYLRGLGIVPAAEVAVPETAGEELLARFAAYLAGERGLAAATVSSYLFQVRPFVAAHADAGRWSLLTAGQVARFVRDGVQYAIAQRGLPPMGFRTLLQRRWRAADSWFGDYPEWLNPEFERRLQLRERWKVRNIRTQSQHRHRPEAVGLLQDPLWQNYFESRDPGNSGLCLHHVHPYFDLRLLRFLFSISPVPWMWDKSLLRLAMRNLLPEAVRLRRKTPITGDPWLIFVRRNRAKFLRAPLNLAAYVDRVKYQVFLSSPGAFGQTSYQFSVRPAVLSAWLDGVTAVQRN